MPQAFWAGIWSVLFLATLNVRAEYFTFEENTASVYSEWKDPAEIISDAAKVTTNLLHWAAHEQGRPVATEKYERLKHFGTWIDNKNTADCYDTRALILMRDSESEVKYSTQNPCKVYSGFWKDPYSGQNLKMAREIEVDHVVALKNAYDSGAWNWDYKHRCLYANFMGFANHLLSVSLTENRAKGDRGPEKWMPTDANFACQHLQNWLAVKFIWQMNMSDEEATAISKEIQDNGCDNKMFQFSKAEINQARKFAEQNKDLCHE